MTLGLVARCDNGGLATMTWEAHRHLAPAKTLVVRTGGPGCGTPRPDRFDRGEVRCTFRNPTAADVRWLCRDTGTLYTAETWYSGQAYGLARRAGARSVLHVMPEYWDRTVTADVLAAPTPWLAPPGSVPLPVPVATDRFERRAVDGVETLYHIASPDPRADRNGTNVLLAALGLVERPVKVLIRQPGRDRRAGQRGERYGNAIVEWLPHHDGPYYEAWPEQADALVMCRRFAGLSLPMLEAAAQGLPVIGSDRAPESGWLRPALLVNAPAAGTAATWRQTRVPAVEPSPRNLAAVIDRLTASPALAAAMSAHMADWADRTSWERLLPRWREVLG